MVSVRVVINESGDVISAQPITWVPSSFDSSALKLASAQAALGWKFKPAQSHGVPVKVMGTIFFNYAQVESYYSKEGAELLRKRIAGLKVEIQSDPNSVLAHYKLGKAYYDKSDYQNAEQEYKRALSIDSRFALAHFSLGKLYHLKERFEEAIEAYQNAIRIRPGYVEPHLGLAWIYRKSNRSEKAIDVLRQVLSISRDADVAQIAYMNIASAYEEVWRIDEAVENYNHVIRHLREVKSISGDFTALTPQFYLKKIASIYEKAKRNREAIRYYLQAIGDNPTSYIASDAFIDVAFLLKSPARNAEETQDREELIQLADEALKTGELNLRQKARVYYAAGVAHEGAGNNQKAIEAYKSAVELTRKEPEAHIALLNLHRKLGDKAAIAKQQKIVMKLARINNIASLGDLIIVKAMLDKGVDVDDRDDFDNTPLISAAGEGQVEVIKLLLERGAELEAQNYLGFSALTRAADRGHFDAVKLLLDRGSDLNMEQSKAGYFRIQDGEISQKVIRRTGLMCAARSGHVDIVKLLIARGADVTVKDENNNTALSYATKKGYSEIVELLKKAGAKE
jgi:tetratricopeptide (TPR) repeat protein